VRKLTAASIAYKTRGSRAAGAAGLRGFVGSSMPPAVLREQLKHTFALHLTKRELGALYARLPGGRDGTVDGAAFLMYFWRLGAKEQKAAGARAREDAERAWLVAAAVEAHKRELVEIRGGVRAAGAGAFGPADARSAYAKIGAASVRPTRSEPVLAPFREGGPLAPGEFARQINRAFSLRLEPREINAVVTTLNDEAYSEGKGDGFSAGVDGDRFLRRVHQMNAKAKRCERVPRPPVVGEWTLSRKHAVGAIASYTNPDLANPRPRINMYGEDTRPKTTPGRLRSRQRADRPPSTPHRDRPPPRGFGSPPVLAMPAVLAL
jgi:hypothetical protein